MCVTIIKHIQRVFAFDLAKLEPLPAEATKLEDMSITNEVLGSYLVWRHSMLLVSLPALFIICILDWIGLAATVENLEVLTAVGKVLLSLPSFASTVLSIAVVWALCGWTQWRKSAHILKIGWLISFVLVFVPALFPLEYILDREAYIQDPDEAVKLLLDVEYDGKKIILAIGYTIILFPVLVTLPAGLAHATHKIRGLFPEAMLSGWVLMFSVPFFPSLT
jgi:hypothetical protein